jgi:hypothetical protein
MFRPPPEYLWRLSKQKYEKQFRRKAPQWVLTLDREFSRRLFNACCRIGLKLHPEVLTLAEEHSGSESVWSASASFRHDQLAKPPQKTIRSKPKP